MGITFNKKKNELPLGKTNFYVSATAQHKIAMICVCLCFRNNFIKTLETNITSTWCLPICWLLEKWCQFLLVDFYVRLHLLLTNDFSNSTGTEQKWFLFEKSSSLKYLMWTSLEPLKRHAFHDLFSVIHKDHSFPKSA